MTVKLAESWGKLRQMQMEEEELYKWLCAMPD